MKCLNIFQKSLCSVRHFSVLCISSLRGRGLGTEDEDLFVCILSLPIRDAVCGRGQELDQYSDDTGINKKYISWNEVLYRSY